MEEFLSVKHLEGIVPLVVSYDECPSAVQFHTLGQSPLVIEAAKALKAMRLGII